MRRHLGLRLRLSGPVVDPQLLDFASIDEVRPGRWPSPRRRRVRSLVEVCKDYGVPPPPPGIHDAAQDAVGAVRLACALVSRSSVLTEIDLDDLQPLQRSWKGLREPDFGHPRALVEEAWPLEYARSRAGACRS
jgi:DNA polymerase-3 subunit epsilon